MGEDRPGAGAEVRLPALKPEQERGGLKLEPEPEQPALKPPAERVALKPPSERVVPRSAPEQLGLKPAPEPERVALKPPPERLALKPPPERLALKPPPGRLALKPPPERLYGRARGHKLRPRQELLLQVTLPRLVFPETRAGDPFEAFPHPPRALWLEVGFGGGEHALAQIAAHPDIGLIACEPFENGICSLLSRLVPEGGEAHAPLPPNLLLWPGDARVLLRSLPDACLDRLFLLFPDPWPKARHAKRRFVHPATLPLLARVLRPGAEWRVATDDPTYQAWVTEVMAAQDLFDAPAPATDRPAGWPPTRYEAKALREGRMPRYYVLSRATRGRGRWCDSTEGEGDRVGR